jgi:hypothetical protein
VTIITDSVIFRKHSKHYTCIIQFRVTKDNGAHADFEVRETCSGQSKLAAAFAYGKALKSKCDLVEKYRKQN